MQTLFSDSFHVENADIQNSTKSEMLLESGYDFSNQMYRIQHTTVINSMTAKYFFFVYSIDIERELF